MIRISLTYWMPAATASNISDASTAVGCRHLSCPRATGPSTSREQRMMPSLICSSEVKLT
jgi:hypothetical protein